jgi:hypothetical protein
MAPLRRLAASAAVVLLVAACAPSHVDTAYAVTSVQGDDICLTLPPGVAAKGQPEHVCDSWPAARIIGGRPLRVGDCVVLRLHPESSGTAQLILSASARCLGAPQPSVDAT